MAFKGLRVQLPAAFKGSIACGVPASFLAVRIQVFEEFGFWVLVFGIWLLVFGIWDLAPGS